MSGNSKLRVRRVFLGTPGPGRPVFRIEDQDGQVLRRIGGARNPAEALAHYWRIPIQDSSVSAAMPDDALQRRIAAARAAMQTHELPLTEPAPVSDAELDSDAEPVAAAQPVATPEPLLRRRRAAAVKARHADLFDLGSQGMAPDATAAQPTEAVEPAKTELEAAPPEPPPVTPEPEPEPEPEPVKPTEQVKATGQKLPAPPEPVPHHLDPHEVMLQRTDPRHLRPTDRPDSFLYHVTSRHEAETALRNGLVVSASDPVILSERPGVPYWLSVLAEDVDVILDGPADFVVLRMRRLTVEALLEPDPHASRSAGSACYLLTGGPR